MDCTTYVYAYIMIIPVQDDEHPAWRGKFFYMLMQEAWETTTVEL